MTEIKWDPEQQQCIDTALNGESFMLMGVGGTGKSTVIKYGVTQMRQDGKTVGITATTGVAANVIDGDIIHSFFGLGAINADDGYSTLIAKIKGNAAALANWRNVDVLILDEVSMLGAEILDMLDAAAKEIRRNSLPFGGIQVILSGDFFQNSPIRTTSDGKKLEPLFAFQSRAYRQIFVKHIELKTIHRQKDEVFQRVLAEVRNGQLSDESARILQQRVGARVAVDGIEPTYLYPMNVDVNAFNNRRLRELNVPIYIFRSMDNLFDQRYAKKLENCRFANTLELAVGAQVMLLANNIVDGLINGSRGVIEGFSRNYAPLQPGSYEIAEGMSVTVRFKTGTHVIPATRADFNNTTGTIVASRFQFPLMLAWASSIHKAQGSQMDCVVINPEKIFAPGMFYVALSRVTSLEGLCLENFNKSKIKTHPIVLKWYQNNFEGNITTKYIEYSQRIEQDATGDFVQFTAETAMDFFLLFVLKYAPLKELSAYPPSMGPLVRDYLNTYKSTNIFEALL